MLSTDLSQGIPMFDFLPPVWNGTLREHYIVLFGAAGSIAFVVGLAGAWLGARFGTRRVVQEVLETLPTNEQQRATSQQLFQLAQAVDAMSIEVERLSEGQRYAAKLLTERSARYPEPPPVQERLPGIITPH